MNPQQVLALLTLVANMQLALDEQARQIAELRARVDSES